MKPAILFAILLLFINASYSEADWPQFMNDARNTGYTESTLSPSKLGLMHQLELGEVILTSPAIVGDRAYVVDQMGRAVCVDVDSGKIVWKSDTFGKAPCGGNTSSPAVVDGKLIFGTTDGHLHFLDAKTGKNLKTFELGWPIVGSVAATTDTVYVATVDSSVHAISLNGEKLWSYDHYELAKRWTDSYDKDADGDRFEQPHFGGAPVCVIERAEGNIVVAPCGYDLVALWDKGDVVEKMWSVNKPATEFDHPAGVSTDGEFLYCAWPKSDGMGAIAQHSLEHGPPISIVIDQWAVLNPPANHQRSVVFNRHAFGTTEIQFSKTRPEVEQNKLPKWRSFGVTAESVTPAISANAMTANFVVTTTLTGELLVFDRRQKVNETFQPNEPVYRYQIPAGCLSTSAPAISNGRIVFGADDGCLYVIGPGGSGHAKEIELAKNRTLEPGNRNKEWPSAFGGDDNTSFVADESVKPPFKLRWAMKSFGLYKHPVCTANGELVYSSFSGIVVCRDQQTGKIHWRRKLPGQAWSRATLLCADDKVFVPRLSSPRYAKIIDQEDALYCLDQATGKILWKNPIGRGDWLRASPVYANGVVAYGSKFETPRKSRHVIGPDQKWKIGTDVDTPFWTRKRFNDSSWIESIVTNDGTIVSTPQKKIKLGLQYYLRTTVVLNEPMKDDEILGVMVGPGDDVAMNIAKKWVEELPFATVDEPKQIGKYVGVAAELTPLGLELDLGEHQVAVVTRRAQLKSNVSSSTSIFPPRLVIYKRGAAQGATIEGWDANTGETRWVHTVDAQGSYIEGPSGCTDGELFYFTGGGAGDDGRGMTMAINPEDGNILWKTDQAYSCRTGTPAIAGDKLLLSGALSRPLAALDLKSGKLLWENDSVKDLTMVHAPSVFGDMFTVNTKYTGGSKCWTVENGQACQVDGVHLDVSGGAHTCGPIVMLSAGYAVATTNNGIYLTNIKTGEIVHKTPGFASQTCPHPALANGRMFYSPQNTGMLFCFEPKKVEQQ